MALPRVDGMENLLGFVSPTHERYARVARSQIVENLCLRRKSGFASTAHREIAPVRLGESSRAAILLDPSAFRYPPLGPSRPVLEGPIGTGECWLSASCDGSCISDKKDYNVIIWYTNMIDNERSKKIDYYLLLSAPEFDKGSQSVRYCREGSGEPACKIQRSTKLLRAERTDAHRRQEAAARSPAPREAQGRSRLV